MHKTWHFYQKYRWLTVVFGLVFVILLGQQMLYHSLPDSIYMGVDDPIPNFDVPVTLKKTATKDTAAFSNTRKKSVCTQPAESYICRLFGLIPIKEITVSHTADVQVIPGGIPVGIYAQTDGVMIIGQGEVTAADGQSYLPAEHLLQAGDYITALDGTPIHEKEEIQQFLSDYTQKQNAPSGVYGTPITIHLIRDKEELDVSVPAVANADGNYQLGIWVRDDLAGVGTLTCMLHNKDYTALGHCVSDYDTNQMLHLSIGKLYRIQIVDIVKGRAGTPGELTGIIDYASKYCLGDVKRNSKSGIIGTLQQIPRELQDTAPVSISRKQEIKKGPAEILSYVDGKKQSYSIMITDVDYQSNQEKDILFQVTDPALIQKTGGIVQGMSGSPILQNGHLIGAVTHVFIRDPEKGYGIFIEDMLPSAS